MNLPLITKENVAGKKVLVRAPFDVPLNGSRVADDTRLKSALPTLKYLLEGGASLVLIGKNGRPEGKRVKKLSLSVPAKHLAKILGRKVKFVPDVVGPRAEKAKKALKPGEILVLENLRFYPKEKERDLEFAKNIATGMDIYVFEDFPNAMNDHAGTTGVAEFLPTFAGEQFAKEIKKLSETMDNPKTPFVAVSGGAKISTKIEILKSLIARVDVLILGGGMANTMLVAEGYDIGKSLYEEEYVDAAEEIAKLAYDNAVELLLPDDVVVAGKPGPRAKTKVKAIDEVNKGEMIVDIGPKSIAKFSEPLKFAGTIFWNGPMGISEYKPSAGGTEGIAHIISESKAISVIGGGDTVASLGDDVKFDFVSTGGGATLEYIAGETLPTIKMFEKK
ncbi:MAG: phosphoglycerate kinase [Patescibacteria group bacterium]|nr:phosphoglycerate kinase [Patescibacteria group bacterium]